MFLSLSKKEQREQMAKSRYNESAISFREAKVGSMEAYNFSAGASITTVHAENDNNNGTYVHTLLAVLIAIAMRRYDTARITRWRRFVAFIKATKHHHRASTCSNIIRDITMPRICYLLRVSSAGDGAMAKK